MNFKIIALLCCFMAPLSTFGQDGEFKGTAKGKRGPINVTVTLVEGMITAIDVTKTKEDKDFVYPLITTAIIDNNNINIDTISGATMTSTGFLAAIEMALIDVPIEYKGEKITPEAPAAETKSAGKKGKKAKKAKKGKKK